MFGAILHVLIFAWASKAYHRCIPIHCIHFARVPPYSRNKAVKAKLENLRSKLAREFKNSFQKRVCPRTDESHVLCSNGLRSVHWGWLPFQRGLWTALQDREELKKGADAEDSQQQYGTPSSDRNNLKGIGVLLVYLGTAVAIGAGIAEAVVGESGFCFGGMRLGMLWPWVLYVTWEGMDFDATLGYPGEGPASHWQRPQPGRGARVFQPMPLALRSVKQEAARANEEAPAGAREDFLRPPR